MLHVELNLLIFAFTKVCILDECLLFFFFSLFYPFEIFCSLNFPPFCLCSYCFRYTHMRIKGRGHSEQAVREQTGTN